MHGIILTTDDACLLALSDIGRISITDTFIVFLFIAAKPELLSLKCGDGTKIEIITSIAPTWKNFGVLLEFDDDGRKLKQTRRCMKWHSQVPNDTRVQHGHTAEVTSHTWQACKRVEEETVGECALL